MDTKSGSIETNAEVPIGSIAKYQLKGLNYVDEDPFLVRALVESNLAKIREAEGLNTQIRVKKVHEREKNCKYQVNMLVNGAGKLVASESVHNNVFAALTEAFDSVKIRLNR
jgi:ribosome-associated translation inhibitor RaiA